MKTPKAVLISDVHYSLSTLELADAAFRAAIDKAADLKVPLIDCGDLTNDKAIIRAEVANRLIETMEYAKSKKVSVNLLIGNHSLVNEKGEEHALNFLRPYANIIDTAGLHLGFYFVPYCSLPEQFFEGLSKCPKGLVICHQGFQGAFMGDYIQDKTSIDPVIVKDYLIYSGHYHRAQKVGTVTYIGNPYTLTFGEANDGPKGFLVLMDDNSIERHALGLRQHIKHEITVDEVDTFKVNLRPDDLLWLKITGAPSQLKKIKKNDIGMRLLGHSNFKLDTVSTAPAKIELPKEELTDAEVFDTIIDSTDEPIEQKTYLKKLWRNIL